MINNIEVSCKTTHYLPLIRNRKHTLRVCFCGLCGTLAEVLAKLVCAMGIYLTRFLTSLVYIPCGYLSEVIHNYLNTFPTLISIYIRLVRDTDFHSPVCCTAVQIFHIILTIFFFEEIMPSLHITKEQHVI